MRENWQPITIRAGAEGATAPETLRPQGPHTPKNSGERRGFASAEGITISGAMTEGASLHTQFAWVKGMPVLIAITRPTRQDRA